MVQMSRGRHYIGTSGWHYKHWLDKFYPTGLNAKDQFSYYLSFFDTVEINNSFYRLPSKETFRKWCSETPENFLFSVKASRFITHMKKLSNPQDSPNLFLSHAAELAEKLGIVLFQLPPGWKINVERFDNFVKALPQDQRFVFEFRNSSWYTEDIYAILRERNCGFCIYELAGHTSPMVITANFVYIRLHGPGNKYQGSYSDESLGKWAEQILQWKDEGKDVYVYFDNDQDAFATYNAITLKDMLRR
jgi:uncharacterized protein YecE (DUF72 family)